ncbi:MAG: hypothetical protein AAGC70_04310 [Pseudomonadota bacterium]
MTPTLMGRWQTRLLLYVFLALPITLVFAWAFGLANTGQFYDPFVFVTALTLIGLSLDVAYIQIQRFRWDNDWPFAFQLFFSIMEFFLTFGLMNLGLFDPFLAYRIPLWFASIHFLLILVPSYFAVVAGIQIFLLRWRFKGGEIGRH